MSIKTVEIICLPCAKCNAAKNIIIQAIKNLEHKYKIHIAYELIHTPHLKDISKYALNPSQTPAILVNGNPEFCGAIKPEVIGVRLDAIHKTS
jgi:hypothetical protein